MELLRSELAWDPQRAAHAARIAFTSTLVIVLAMVYQIPLAAPSGYVVFLLARESARATLVNSAVGAVAATLSVALSLVFYLADAGEPALRLALMTLSAFTGMYLMRVLTIGPAVFLVGYVLVLSQTLIDRVPNLEALTHLVLWLWVVAMLPDAATTLMTLLFDRRAHTAQAQDRPHGLFVADAWTNPAHRRFALKATVCVLLAYITYNVLDWQGINTAVTTCFFVSLENLRATLHKATLRFIGAAIGCTAAALSVVFIIPHMTDIGHLILLVGSFSMLAAWVATSTPRIAYAGMQMAFAFFTGVLQGFGPASDLDVLRDRIVGIALGNIIVTIVFSSVWRT